MENKFLKNCTNAKTGKDKRPQNISLNLICLVFVLELLEQSSLLKNS